MIHIDTGFLIRALLPGSDEDARLRGWVESGEPLAISSVAWAEFLCGPLAAEDATLASAIFGEALPFTAQDAAVAAAAFNAGGRRRGTLADCMIAAVAVGADASLATSNHRDFRDIPYLRLID